MGNKKPCSCMFWNQAQQECLYYGTGCAYDKKVEPEYNRREWIRGLKGEELKRAFADCKVERHELDAEQQKFLKKVLRDRIAELRAMSARLEES